MDGSDEEKTIMWEGVDDDFQRTVRECVDSGRQYRISFGGPTPLHDAEALPVNRVKSLAVRLVRAATGKFLPVLNWAALPEGEALLQDVVKRLSGGQKNALIVLNLDETNVVMSSEEGKQYLRSVLAALTGVNQLKVGFVFATLSGTNVRPLHNLLKETSSGVPPKEIPLPLLEVKHMQEVLLDLQQRQKRGWSLGQQLDFALEVLGGVPRYLEMLAFLLGEQDGHFTHRKYCAELEEGRCDAHSLLERVKGLILEQYGDEFVMMLGGVPRRLLAAYSLFGWPVTRDFKIGDDSVGDLEAQGCVFVTGNGPNVTLHVPLVLLLLCLADGRGPDAPMLLTHFDVVLSPDENERASLALLALKSAAQQEINGGVCVNQLFPDARVPWAEDQMTFEDFGIWEAESRITQETWETALPKLQKRGAFVVNCKGAPFADMIMVPKDGQFAIFIQEKQGEGAKEKQLAGKTVPTFKIGDVRREHDKCNVPFRHLFVLITDKGFDAVDKLAPNELVLPYDQHGAVMGPLLALLRKFNHSNKRKITVQ